MFHSQTNEVKTVMETVKQLMNAYHGFEIVSSRPSGVMDHRIPTFGADIYSILTDCPFLISVHTLFDSADYIGAKSGDGASIFTDTVKDTLETLSQLFEPLSRRSLVAFKEPSNGRLVNKFVTAYQHYLSGLVLTETQKLLDPSGDPQDEVFGHMTLSERKEKTEEDSRELDAAVESLRASGIIATYNNNPKKL